MSVVQRCICKEGHVQEVGTHKPTTDTFMLTPKDILKMVVHTDAK